MGAWQDSYSNRKGLPQFWFGVLLSLVSTLPPLTARGQQEGDLNWAIGEGGTGHDRAWGMAALADGGAVIVGSFVGSITIGSDTLVSDGNEDIFLARYDGDGIPVWARRAGGSETDEARTVTSLVDGSIYIAGRSNSNPAMFGSIPLPLDGNGDFFLAKYDVTDGSPFWVRRATSPANYGFGVAPLPDGGAVAAGGLLSGIHIERADGAGNQTLIDTVSGDVLNSAYDVATLADGVILVTGVFGGMATFGSGDVNETTLTASGPRDIFVARYNADGSLDWARRAGGSAVGDVGFGISGALDGGAIVTGTFAETADFGGVTLEAAGLDEIFIAKYSPLGLVEWVLQAGSAATSSTDDAGYDIAPLPDGSFVVAGTFIGAADFNGVTLTAQGARDTFVSRHASDGTLLWLRQVRGPEVVDGRALGVSPDGRSVYLAGHFLDSASTPDDVTAGLGETNETTLTSAGLFDIYLASFTTGFIPCSSQTRPASADSEFNNYEPAPVPIGATPQLGVCRSTGLSRQCNATVSFDLAFLPADFQLTRATLNLYALSESEYIANDFHVCRITENWNEAGASWTNRTASELWTTPGGTFALEDESVIEIPSLYGGGSGASGPYDDWFAWDVTKIVRSWVDGTHINYGFLLWQEDISAPRNQYIGFASRDHPNLDFHPFILLEGEVGCAVIQGDVVYQYDDADRLIAVRFKDGRRILYAYDEASNRIGKVVTSQLVIEQGPLSYPALNILNDTVGHPIIQLRLIANEEEDIEVSSLTIAADGLGDDSAGIAAASLYLDADRSGTLSGPDTLLSSATFASDNGSIPFIWSPPITIPLGETRDLVVTVDFNPSGVNDDDTFSASWLENGHIHARGADSARAILPLGAPVSGSIQTISAVADPVPEPPGKPTTPVPTDMAMAVPINTDLAWTGGAITDNFNVYFGTSAGGGQFQSSQPSSDTDFAITDTLAYDTTYTWRVDAVNDDGTTTGDVWSFTTVPSPTPLANIPPSPPSDPTPANGSSVSPTLTQISFSQTGLDPDGVVIAYSFELWREEPGPMGPIIVDARSGLSVGPTPPQFTLSEPLVAGVPYYLRARAIDDDGESGPFSVTTSFTANPPAVELVTVQSLQSIDITYTDSMGESAADPERYAILGSGQGTFATSPDAVMPQSPGTYRLTWNSGEMRVGGDVTISATDVTDAAGNALGSSSSATDNGGGLGELPTVTSVQVLTPYHIRVVFSEALDATGSITANYVVSGDGQGSLTPNPEGIQSSDSITYVLHWPAGGMIDGGDITITASNVADLAGNPIGDPNAAMHPSGGIAVSEDTLAHRWWLYE